ERRDAPVRLDGVMRKELRELAFAFARMALDPPRDAIVRSRTIASRKALVRDLLGQHVAERVLAFTDDHRPESRVDEPAPLRPPPHPGWRAASSGRAGHTNRSGPSP